MYLYKKNLPLMAPNCMLATCLDTVQKVCKTQAYKTKVKAYIVLSYTVLMSSKVSFFWAELFWQG